MKSLKYLLLLIFSISFISCDKKNNEVINNPDVEKYIEFLKKGKYESSELPDFTFKDIPALLEYRNETYIIEDFPHNGISSLWLSECKLGMYVLWTIESIRAVAINSEYLIGRFPSQNPILAYRESLELDLVSDNESHSIATKAYYDWWENNRNKDFSDFKNIDPLVNTNYKWH